MPGPGKAAPKPCTPFRANSGDPRPVPSSWRRAPAPPNRKVLPTFGRGSAARAGPSCRPGWPASELRSKQQPPRAGQQRVPREDTQAQWTPQPLLSAPPVLATSC